MTENEKGAVKVAVAVGAGIGIGWLLFGCKKSTKTIGTGPVNVHLTRDTNSMMSVAAYIQDTNTGDLIPLDQPVSFGDGKVNLSEDGSPVSANLPPGDYKIDIMAYGG